MPAVGTEGWRRTVTAFSIIAADISTRNMGWCASTRRDWSAVEGPHVPPAIGLVRLPGMQNLGKLNAAVRNSLCDLVERFGPVDVLAWCMPMFRDSQTTAEALLGVAAVAHLTAFDYSIRPLVVVESTVRKAILGRGAFGLRDGKGKLIKGSGTGLAKAAVLAWCSKNGFDTTSDDTADAAVLWAYARRQLSAEIGKFKRRAA